MRGSHFLTYLQQGTRNRALHKSYWVCILTEVMLMRKHGMSDSRVMGLYHNMETFQFACLVHYAPLDEAPTWKLMIGGTEVPWVECKMEWITFASIKEVRDYLRDNGFFACNKNIILCPSEKYTECMNDLCFWDAISRVYGPDSASVVVYDTKKKPYRISALERLGYWGQDHLWIWYGRDTDPAIEAWLTSQMLHEVTELAMHVAVNDWDEVCQNRQVQVCRMAYETEVDEETGKEYNLLFQYQNGEVIEI